MATLEERLGEIEERLRGGLLKANYEGLSVYSGGECLHLVIKYINLAPTVVFQDIIFIKQLTKVASHIMLPEVGLDISFLEKVYQFNLDGVKVIREGTARLSQNNLLNVMSHFFHMQEMLPKNCFMQQGTEGGQRRL